LFSFLFWSQTASDLLDSLFPPICCFCHEARSQTIVRFGFSAFGCNNCLDQLKLNRAACRICAQTASIKSPCNKCLRRPPAFDRAWSPYLYTEPLITAIHRLKFGKDTRLIPILSALFIRKIEQMPQLQNVDMILPVPLSNRRLRLRGFNQSQLLAKRIAKLLSIPNNPALLFRIQHTQAQAELSLAARKKNVANSFLVKDRKGLLKDAHVLLIDDVMTTGATVNACAKILKQQGRTKQVTIVTLARA